MFFILNVTSCGMKFVNIAAKNTLPVNAVNAFFLQ